jgi:NTP pyrophosphatase (non-canonical NTP hydrolase)
MLTFKQLQEEQKAWVKHNFPNRTFEDCFKGIVEEVGELSHSLLKQNQGIRGTHEEHEALIKDAVGDIVVFLSDFCEARGYDFQTIVEKTWFEVKQRNWKQNSLTGK